MLKQKLNIVYMCILLSKYNNYRQIYWVLNVISSVMHDFDTHTTFGKLLEKIDFCILNIPRAVSSLATRKRKCTV